MSGRRGQRHRRISVQHDEVVRLYTDGRSVDVIGALLGFRGDSIRHYLQREGVMPRSTVGSQLRQSVQRGLDRGGARIICEWPPRRGGRD